jgi:hypothetical protein
MEIGVNDPAVTWISPMIRLGGNAMAAMQAFQAAGKTV